MNQFISSVARGLLGNNVLGDRAELLTSLSHYVGDVLYRILFTGITIKTADWSAPSTTNRLRNIIDQTITPNKVVISTNDVNVNSIMAEVIRLVPQINGTWPSNEILSKGCGFANARISLDNLILDQLNTLPRPDINMAQTISSTITAMLQNSFSVAFPTLQNKTIRNSDVIKTALYESLAKALYFTLDTPLPTDWSMTGVTAYSMDPYTLVETNFPMTRIVDGRVNWALTTHNYADRRRVVLEGMNFLCSTLFTDLFIDQASTTLMALYTDVYNKKQNLRGYENVVGFKVPLLNQVLLQDKVRLNQGVTKYNWNCG